MNRPTTTPRVPGEGRRSVFTLLPAFALIQSFTILLALPACDSPRADPAPEAPVLEGAERCVNEVEGYTVEVPAGWHVNQGEPLAPCSVFHPEPFQLPLASEVPIDLAILMGVEPVPMDRIGGEVRGRMDLERQEVTVAGRPALRLDSQTTGEGLHDAGIRIYQYLVELPHGRTLVAATYDVGDLDSQWKREVLDAMMAGLVWTEEGP